jgi:hypothetical protein
VRKVVLSVFVSAGNALIVEHLNVVVEPAAGRFIIIDQPSFTTDALDKPDRGAV